MARKKLITFNGWDGQWWRRINVGKGIYDAATFVMPFKYSLALWGIEAVTGITPESVFKSIKRRLRGPAKRTRKSRS